MLLLLVLLIYITLSITLYKAFYLKDDYENNHPEITKISVIVAAKNESNNVKNLITSLSKQNFSKDNFEVIIVDDNSSDNTFEIANSLTKDLSNFKVIKAKNKKYPAKKGALDYGISLSKFDSILITDCDAEPNSNWISSYSKLLRTYDFVFGKLLIKDSNNFITKITQFEKLRNSILIYAATKLKMPYCTYGPNFGYKKSAFYKVKGFEKTLETLSGDDDLLLREAVKNNLKIGYLIDDSSAVLTGSKKDLLSYIKQRTRHTSTSHSYLFKHKFFLALWHLSSIVLTSSTLSIPIVFFINIDLAFYFVIITLIKLIIDSFLILSCQKSFHYKFSILNVFIHQLIYDIMLIINYITSLFNKNNWDK